MRAPLVLSLVLLAGCAATGATQAPGGVAGAVDAVLRSNPELSSRLTGSLPPTTLQAARREEGGWHVSVLTWGSGRPGILAADCFSVSETGVVSRIGRFQNGQMTSEVSRVDPATCTAVER